MPCKMESVYNELMDEIESNRRTTLENLFKKYENAKEYNDIVDFETMTIISRNKKGRRKITEQTLGRAYKMTKKNETGYSMTSKGRALMKKIACHIRSGGRLNEASSKSKVKNSTISCVFSNKPEFTTERNDLVLSKSKVGNSTVSCVFSNKPEFTTDRNDLASSKISSKVFYPVFSNKPEFTTERNDLVPSKSKGKKKRIQKKKSKVKFFSNKHELTTEGNDLVSSKTKVKKKSKPKFFSNKPEPTTDRNNLDTVSRARYTNPVLRVRHSKSTYKISNTYTPVKDITFCTRPSLSSFYKNISICSIVDDHLNDTNASIGSHKEWNAFTDSYKSKSEATNRRKSFKKRAVGKEPHAIRDDNASDTELCLENFKSRHPEIKLVECSVVLKRDISRKPVHNNSEMSVPARLLDGFLLNRKTVSRTCDEYLKSRDTLPVINCQKNDHFSVAPKREAPLFIKRVILTSFDSKCYNFRHKTVPVSRLCTQL
ncbi:hypothetical protein TNCV_269921 [Trichonephila clavipes]|nr:hypothetical protein TNCV_269921 [Trichonephila clavipes]